MATERLRVRRFTIADGMILVAALAAGLAWTAKLVPLVYESNPHGVPWTSGLASWDPVFRAALLALPILLTLTLTTPALRLRRPRPVWRRLARQPGFAASLAAVLTTLVGMGLMLFVATIHPRPNLPSLREILSEEYVAGLVEFVAILAPLIGLAVATAWTSLLVQGRWRCEASWVDRLGRLVGLGWIAMVPILGVFWLVEIL